MSEFTDLSSDISAAQAASQLELKLSEIPFVETHLDERLKRQVLDSRKLFVRQQYIVYAVLGVITVVGVALIMADPFGTFAEQDMMNRFIIGLVWLTLVWTAGIIVGIGGQNVYMRKSPYFVFNKWYRKNKVKFETEDAIVESNPEKAKWRDERQAKMLAELVANLNEVCR